MSLEFVLGELGTAALGLLSGIAAVSMVAAMYAYVCGAV